MRKPNFERYVLNRWGHCPYCDSTQIEGQAFNFEGNTVWQEISCLDCDSRWHDIYTLTAAEPAV